MVAVSAFGGLTARVLPAGTSGVHRAMGWCQGQNGREHNPGHELEQQYAPNHLGTALRATMNITTVIPTVVNIQIAKTRLPATAI
jgi:hypothetical protein